MKFEARSSLLRWSERGIVQLDSKQEFVIGADRLPDKVKVLCRNALPAFTCQAVRKREQLDLRGTLIEYSLRDQISIRYLCPDWNPW